MAFLAINNLSVCVENKRVVQSCTITLKQGSTQVLMGPNGSGKSSLANALMGHPKYIIEKGTIIFDGIDITSMTCDQRARLGLFLTFQNPPAITGLSVFNFLREAHHALCGKVLELELFKKELLQALAVVNMPETFLQRNVHEDFSGGEKKRFELLQVLLFKPRFVMFDEIDAGLDIDGLKAIARIVAHIKTQAPQTTMLFITHYHHLMSYINPVAMHIMLKGNLCHSGALEVLPILEERGYQFFEEKYGLL